MIRGRPASPALHRFACVAAAAAFVLLVAGATVTSTRSGLSVPDWPLSFGSLLPRMAGGVVFEHSHRLIAGTVALLLVVLGFWMGRSEGRAWVRRLAYAAVGLVVAQALLGGATVLLRLPPVVSVAHAGTAMLVFTLVLILAVVTSRAWREAPADLAPGSSRLLPWISAVAALVYAQILVGAIVRHTGAGLACPDFPLCQGRLVPSLTSFPVAIHFVHRAGALVVGLSVAALAIVVARVAPRALGLVRLARLAFVLVLAQITLGALSVTTRLAVPVTVAHLAVGALLLATILAQAAWTSRLGVPVLAAPPDLREPERYSPAAAR